MCAYINKHNQKGCYKMCEYVINIQTHTHMCYICVSIIFTHRDSRKCYRFRVLCSDSPCVIYGKKTDALIEAPISNDSDPLERRI